MLNLFLVAFVVACIAWTVTQEQIFAEPRELCKRQSVSHPRWYCRKFFYLFTCEYCFSHWVSIVAVYFSGVRIVAEGFTGNIFAFFAVVYTANFIMSVYRRLRLSIKLTGLEAKRIEKELEG